MIIQSLEKLIVNGKELSDSEVQKMDVEIEAARSAQRFGTRPERKGMDAYEVEAHRQEVIAGRRAGPESAWRQVMERFDFVWYHPKQLDQKLGKQVVIPQSLEGVPDPSSIRARDVQNQNLWFHRPHPEGQWRNDLHRPIPKENKLAFTESDLLGLFTGPESFATWIEEHFLQIRMRRAGLVRPR